MEDFRQFFKGVKAGLSCVDAPSDTGFFSLSSSKRRVKRCRVSGLFDAAH